MDLSSWNFHCGNFGGTHSGDQGLYELTSGWIDDQVLSFYPDSMIETLRDLVRFLAAHKKWWLIPVLIFLVLFGALIIYAHGTAVAPFVYSFF